MKLLQNHDVITVSELQVMSAKMFEKIVKVVVDVEKQIIMIDPPMHSDQE